MPPLESPEKKRSSIKKMFRSPLRRRSSRKMETIEIEIDTVTVSVPVPIYSSSPESVSPRKLGLSLGVGSMSPEGSVVFSPSSSPTKSIAKKGTNDRRMSSPPSLGSSSGEVTTKLFQAPVFVRQRSSFLRVADLDMEETSHSGGSSDDGELFPNFHHAASDPPPGVDHDPKELWVALNDGDGSHAPIAPMAVDRLARFGLEVALDKSMWTPDSKTDKIMQRNGAPEWLTQTFKPTGCVKLPKEATPDDKEVMVWSGTFRHGCYGSDLPAIRAAGIVDMSAQSLMELLVDSTRVKEYNKMSLGRADLVTFQDNIRQKGVFGHSITKVMRSETKPPMIRKTLVFISLLHSQALEDGSGYLVVTRAVYHPDDGSSQNVIMSEILIGVNLIRQVGGEENKNRCLMININHIRSPMIPMMVAKRLGVAAACNFLNDIRALAENEKTKN